MGLFGDYDMATAPDDPWAAPVGTWAAVISRVSTFEYTDSKTSAEETALSIQYDSVDDNLPGQAKDSFVLPNKAAEEAGLITRGENTKRAARINQRMLQLEIPKARINTVTPDQLEGLTVTVTTKQTLGRGNNEGKTFTNVNNVVLRYGDNDVVSTPAKSASDEYDFSVFQDAS